MLCFRIVLVAKKPMDKTEGASIFLVECFVCHPAGKIRKGTF